MAPLLSVASSLTVVVTRRAPLRIAGEFELALPPLARDPAVQLFVERARAHNPVQDARDGSRVCGGAARSIVDAGRSPASALIGAAEAERERAGTRRKPDEVPFVEDTTRRLERTLGHGGLESGRERGHGLNLGERSRWRLPLPNGSGR